MKNYIVLFVSLILVLFISCQDEEKIRDMKENTSDYELSQQQVQNMLLSYIQTIEKAQPQTKSSVIQITNMNKEYYSNKIATRASSYNYNIPVYTVDLKSGNQSGFAIVVGDKRLPVVLAYSPRGNFNKLADYDDGSIQNYINNIPSFINTMIMNTSSLPLPDVTNKYTVFYEDSEHNGTDFTYSWTTEDGTNQELHFLHEDIVWEQGEPYSNALPYCMFRRQHYLVGCGALALANIMAYERFPSKYNWDLITDGLSLADSDSEEKHDAVTNLLKDLFEATNTRYDSVKNVSLSSEDNNYYGIVNMGYKCDAMAYWDLDKIGISIKRNFPVWMGARCTHKEGIKSVTHGHAFVIRGWWKFKLPTQADTEYGVSLGVNWGNRGGFGDGWYLVQYDGMNISTMGLSPLMLDSEGHIYSYHNYNKSIVYLLNIRPNGSPLDTPTHE